MTEQTTYVGAVKVEGAKEIPIQYPAVVTGSPQAIIELHADFREVPPQHSDKALAERLNEAYGGEMQQEERGFLKHAKDYHRRRLSAPNITAQRSASRSAHTRDRGTPGGYPLGARNAP